MKNNLIDLRDGQIGLGTFPFSSVFSQVSQDEATDIVKTFLNLGGRYIETAPIYPRTIDLGAILRKFPRESYLLGTKCVLYIGANGVTESSGRPESLREQCLSEISRLGVEHIDLLQTHITPVDVQPEIALAELNKLRVEGLVRFVGVSNATTPELRLYLKGGKIDFVQNRYSVIYRSLTENLAEVCKEYDVHFNPYQVIERGQLISTSSNAGRWRDGDLRQRKAEYIGDAFHRVHKWAIGELLRIAERAGLTLEALCIRWAFSQPQVTLPVVGATKVWQVERNMASGNNPLPTDVLSAVDGAYMIFAQEVRKHFGLSIEEFRGLA